MGVSPANGSRKSQPARLPLQKTGDAALRPLPHSGHTYPEMVIHLRSHSKERLNIYATAATNYSCCFTKFPFESTSNPDSFPFAFTNTS